jgi:hypothetical protein
VRWWLSPRRGDGVSGVAKFLVRDDTPIVGAVGKNNEEGGLPMGCYGGRTEEGKRTEVWRRRWCPFEAEVR